MKFERSMLTVWCKPVTAVALSCALIAMLQGCVGVVVGGAVVGALSATDRRTLGAQTEDQAIMLKGENRIGEALGKSAHVNVNSFNRRVLLTGEVPADADKLAAENIARGIDGVMSVTNELQIGFTSSLTARSNDLQIATKVKTSMVVEKNLYANAFKIVVEDGVVYLMGRVTQHEGDLGAEIARSVNGVRRVVKLFEYISEQDLQQMMASPNKKTNGGQP